jgi:hypothetical protein
MKSLGTKQFEQKTYKTIKVSEQWRRFLGNLMHGFKMLVYGESGNGKTEFLLQFVKEMVSHGIVSYISYEQGHGMDLQMAIRRNKDDNWNGGVIWIDPWHGLPEKFKEPLIIDGKQASPQFQELVHYLRKRSSGDFIFIDSIQDSLFEWHEYKYLVQHFKRKSFVFISLAESKKPKGSVAKAIKANTHLALEIRDYIAFNAKNRMMGDGEWIIWEQKAMENNPLYFEMQQKKQKKEKRTKSKVKPNNDLLKEL